LGLPERVRALALVAGGYTLFFVWFYGRPLLEGTYLTESDLYEQYLPMFLAEAASWSSYEFSGFPVFADAQNIVGYLPYLLFDGFVHWWTAIPISAHVLAASFTYLYVLNITGSRAAAVFAGAAYALSEAMVERIAHLTILHAIAWLPLILWCVDRVRETRRLRWVGLGAIALGQCFLSGHPQMALYTYYVTIAYALVGGRAERAPRRYYAAVAAMFVVGALLTGIKAVPVLEASRFTARQETSFSQFAGHSNSPAQMLSVVFPTILHEGREAPTYVGLVTLLLAIAAGLVARRHWRTAFWVVVALCGFMLGAGANTPLAYVAYYVPGYDRFRVGARHLFLAAFGCAVLAGLALAEIQARRLPYRAIARAAAVVGVLLGCGAVAMLVFSDAFRFEQRAPDWPLPLWPASIWLQFVIGMVSAAVVLWAVRTPRSALAAAGLLAVLAADTLHAIPYRAAWNGIDAVRTHAEAIEKPSVHAERLASDATLFRQRILAIGGSAVDPVAPAAFARVWRIPIAGGYNPMLLGHYAALASMDSNGVVKPAVLSPDDVSLDLLAVRYVLVREADLPELTLFRRHDFEWDTNPLGLSIGRADCGHRYDRRVSIPLATDVEIASIGLVTFLRCSEDVPQGAEVASVHLVAEDRRHIAPLRAGIETAETGLFDQTLRARAKHEPARVFGDANPGSPLVYFARIDLPSPIRARRLELHAPGTGGWTVVQHLTLAATDGQFHPVASPQVWLRDRQRWKEVSRFATSRKSDRGADEHASDEQMVTVFENQRARPRAWIVPEVVGMADADALETIRRSQGPDGRRFDPVQTALVDPADVRGVRLLDRRSLGGGGQPDQATATPARPASATVDHVENGRIRIRASTSSGGFLVLSETFYPGWQARINGRPARVYRTNVALQGVVVPAGDTTVEFEFAPRSLRVGATLSLIGAVACLLLLALDAAGGRRRM
jgi:hypothetical protein